MIKINLLSEGRRPVVARRAKAPLSFGGQEPNNVLMIAGIVLGALVAGAWWYHLNSKLSAKTREVRAAQARYDELEPIIRKVEDFKAKNAELERKIQIIKDLKAKQKGPVQIMDAVSKSLPDLVWLKSMNVTGASVTMSGSAFNTNAVAAFIENLQEIPRFEEPDAKNIQASRGGEFYDFQLTVPIRPLAGEGEDDEG